jgi:hypothetical protein
MLDSWPPGIAKETVEPDTVAASSDPSRLTLAPRSPDAPEETVAEQLTLLVGAVAVNPLRVNPEQEKDEIAGAVVSTVTSVAFGSFESTVPSLLHTLNL